jgi:hypothetical protein
MPLQGKLGAGLMRVPASPLRVLFIFIDNEKFNIQTGILKRFQNGFSAVTPTRETNA